jgi:putative membrane protein
MADTKAKAWRTISWHGLFLVLGLVLFAGLIHGVGLGAVWDALEHLGWLTPLIAVPYSVSYLVDSVGWWWVLRHGFDGSAGNPKASPRLLDLFTVRAAGEAVNAITPTAYLGGEPLKAWLLRRHGVPLAEALASVLVSKTALMLTQGAYVLLGLLVALHGWSSSAPLAVVAAFGLLLGLLIFGLIIGVQRRGLFGLLLGLSRRWSGREALLASWEADLLALDERLRGFYASRARDFLICCGLHLLGWMACSLEVYVVLRLLGHPVDFGSAFAIEALSGVAKLGSVIVPGSLGVQEGGLVVIFVAFGLTPPLAVTFGLLRRARELLWIGVGLAVLVHHHALGWLRGRGDRAGEAG